MESILVPFPAGRKGRRRTLAAEGESLLNVVNNPHFVVIKPQKVKETAQEEEK
jgi:hypothetical protein